MNSPCLCGDRFRANLHHKDTEDAQRHREPTSNEDATSYPNTVGLLTGCRGIRVNPRLISVTLDVRSAIYDLPFTIHSSCLLQTLKRSSRSRSVAASSIHHRTFMAAWAAHGITARWASKSPTTFARRGGVGWFTSATTWKGWIRRSF